MPGEREIAQALLSSYEPSLRDRVGNAIYDIAQALGMGSTANRMRNEGTAVLDFIPGVGEVLGVNDAMNDFNAGNYGMAAAGLGLTAVGAVPGVGDAAAATARRFLPSSASLNIPRAPSIEELSTLARMEDVPVSQLRGSQSTMNWDGYNRGEYGEPMFGDFSIHPVVARRNDGEYIVFDGHHRSVSALNEGVETIPTWVIDASAYDPANAGRTPSPDTTDLDELMRDLGL